MNFYLRVIFALVLCITSAQAKRVEFTHLVTMTKAELMQIVDCVSHSKSQTLCDILAVCNSMMPKLVTTAYEKCDQEINPNGLWRCNELEKLYPSIEIPSKIFDCILENTNRLSAEESRKMVEFETCARELYTGGCKLSKRRI